MYQMSLPMHVDQANEREDAAVGGGCRVSQAQRERTRRGSEDGCRQKAGEETTETTA